MVWDREQHEARVTRGQLVDLWECRNVFNVVKLFNFKINKPGTNFTKQKSIYINLHISGISWSIATPDSTVFLISHSWCSLAGAQPCRSQRHAFSSLQAATPLPVVSLKGNSDANFCLPLHLTSVFPNVKKPFSLSNAWKWKINEGDGHVFQKWERILVGGNAEYSCVFMIPTKCVYLVSLTTGLYSFTPLACLLEVFEFIVPLPQCFSVDHSFLGGGGVCI